MQSLALIPGMPILGAGLTFYGIRDGEIIGYVLGPAMIWVSGGVRDSAPHPEKSS